MDGRIVHLCYAGTSGSSRVALNIARGSRRPGRHAYVLYGVVPARADYLADLEAMGCAWRAVPKRRGLDMTGYRAAAAAICELRPAAAVLHGSRSVPVALSLRLMSRALPIVAVQHGPAGEVASVPRRCACMLFSAVADRSVAVSGALAECISEHRLFSRLAAPLLIIPNGVDGAFWRADPPRGDPARPMRLGMVATLEAYKDHLTLLRAVKHISDAGRRASLELVGAGPQEQAIRDEVARLGLQDKVNLTGDLSRRQVRRRLHSWDVLVHATRTEAMPMAVLEAMASGRAVVATASVGVRELIRDGRTGLLVPCGDAEALAGAILRLMDSPALAGRLGAAARRFTRENHSIERMAEAYEKLVDELLG